MRTVPKDWPVPPGHYRLLASYADGFLQAGPFMITWAALNDATDEPDVPDQLGDFVVLDVRTEAQYNARHIPGAVNIPYATLAQWLADRASVIVRTGTAHRTAPAAGCC